MDVLPITAGPNGDIALLGAVLLLGGTALIFASRRVGRHVAAKPTLTAITTAVANRAGRVLRWSRTRLTIRRTVSR
jgi:hypothetical protein